MIEYFTLCPFCNAEISFLLDPSVSFQKYIEDCEVCCRPLELTMRFESNEVVAFNAEALEQ